MSSDEPIPDYYANNDRAVKAWPKFAALKGRMSLRDYGHGVEAARRVQDAWYALGEWRYATGQREYTDQTLAVAVRLSADTFAQQIAAAGHEYDERTIRWVLAGLRCPAQPFCTGCDACQTVTSPERVRVA